MKNILKKTLHFLFSKLFWILTAVALQLAIVFYLFLTFTSMYYVFGTFLAVLKIIFMFGIINSEAEPAYKSVWLTVLLINTFAGVILYLFFGRVKLSSKMKKRIEIVACDREKRKETYPSSYPDDANAKVVCKYLASTCNSAPFEGNKCEFFSVGEEFFERLYEELEKAEKYIYFEYFIICGGKVWDRLFEILSRKISEGVDVRLIYDDFGSVLKIDGKFAKKLSGSGIKTRAFNRISTNLTSIQNYRDHRKMCIIDGVKCFVGGINLSDEYSNIASPFGHWKDTALLISGSAAEAYTSEFLISYNGFCSENAGTGSRIKNEDANCRQYGTVAPYFDDPFTKKQVARDIYVQLINNAKESVFITTPYFIPDYSVETAIKNALARGVNVKVIIPGIYDKSYVREVSRSRGSRIGRYGAEIYEYSPGFIHQKMLVTDGKYAVLGSSNLDYRSFYLSFECGAFLYNAPAICDMIRDFEATLERSKLFKEEKGDVGLLKWLFRHTFAFFSPLL